MLILSLTSVLPQNSGEINPSGGKGQDFSAVESLKIHSLLGDAMKLSEEGRLKSLPGYDNNILLIVFWHCQYTLASVYASVYSVVSIYSGIGRIIIKP